jgi:predicted PurR-regulated permease PerM
VAFINSKCDENGKFLGFFEPNDIINKFSIVNIIGEIDVDKLSAIADGVYRFGVAIIDAVLAIFSSVYMLLSRENLMRSVGKVLSIFTDVKTVSSTKRYLGKVADIFYSYMYGTIIDALIVAVLCIIAFFIIGIDYAPLFGVLVGISNLVPYFGAIIAGVGVSIFAALSEGLIPALITAACILVIQQVDCNVLQPRIVGRSVGLKPIYTLIAITVGGGIFGVGGILLGVPVFATLIMMFNDIAERHYQKLAREDMDQAVEDAVVEDSLKTSTENKENSEE